MGLGLSGTKSKLFSCYDLSAKTKCWWNGYSGREVPLTMEADAGSVAVAEMLDKAVGIQLLGKNGGT